MKTLTTSEGKVLEIEDILYDALLEKFEKVEGHSGNELDDFLTYKNTHIYRIIDNKPQFICDTEHILEKGDSTSFEQLESILELNRLANVVNKLNGDFTPEPEWNYYKFVIELKCRTQDIFETAKQLLGEESIKKALTLNYK